MSNAFIYAIVSERETQFANFDQWLDAPVWKGCKILDFGGNIGGFLAGAGSRVNHDDYWCLDLNRQVIEIGREKFSHAHFAITIVTARRTTRTGFATSRFPTLG